MTEESIEMTETSFETTTKVSEMDSDEYAGYEEVSNESDEESREKIKIPPPSLLSKKKCSESNKFCISNFNL
jgi:hypothetical protein